MDIVVYAEDLVAYTSAMPSREMLRELISLRADDHFVLVFRKGSQNGAWVQPYIHELPSDRVSMEVMPTTRRQANLHALAGLRGAWNIASPADVYLRFDAGLLGKRSHPLICLVADLSVFDRSESSLAWHGRYLFKKALKDTAESAESIVTISNDTRQALITRYPSCANRVHVIPNGIADQWFGEAESVQHGEVDYWIWYGQMTPRKNLVRVLDAYAGLLAEDCNLPRLKLVGRPAHGGAAVLERIDMLGISPHVDVIEPLPLRDLISIVRGSRGLVFASLQEGFGMPIIEAMAQGRPVLTSNRTAMPEVAGGIAVLCDPLDTNSIKAGMRELHAPNQLDPSAVEARHDWARHFTARSAAERYSALIDKAYKDHVQS